ncbi:patatin-like phospholipase family protein [Bradyrhizobium sp. 179]|uniref:hypothetical protein n=1 Tax=Bradyrhizobium sp. 179 TaxID=2782648 RepID=UPI001FF783F5|nr:hypothetical protein [Bradyrhizobium sp. 179]MCK1542039.1 patatin-like phospholipase family protein [Bradyrhizobium sp. 179]
MVSTISLTRFARRASIWVIIIILVIGFCVGAGLTRAWAALGIIVRPALFLWPWLIGAAAFHAIIRSDQGAAIAHDLVAHEDSTGVTIASLFVAWLLVALGCLLALVASTPKPIAARVGTNKSRPQTSARVLSSGIWLGALSISPSIMFSHATSLMVAWIITGLLGLVVAVGTAWTALSGAVRQSAARRFLRFVLTHSFWFSIIAILSALVPIVIGAGISMRAPSRLAEAGTLLIAMVGIAANATLFGVALVVVPLSLQKRWIGAAVAGIMALWIIVTPAQMNTANPLLEDARVQAEIAWATQRQNSCVKAPSNLLGALDRPIEHATTFADERGNDNRFFLVSAEGGGIRAAYWTALSLERLSASSNGRFAERVVSLAGVSGGSLGIATWLAAQERRDLDSEGRFHLIERFLMSDFLSPLAGGLLFLDMPRFLFGPLWFSAGRDQAFEKALADLWHDLGKTDFFYRPFMDLCVDGFKAAPAVFFVSTDVLSGSAVSLSPTSVMMAGRTPLLLSLGATGLYGSFENTSLVNATVAQAVHMSARFPYLSPPAVVGVNPEYVAMQGEWNGKIKDLPKADRKHASEEAFKRIRASGIAKNDPWPLAWVLVDGGYVDNTGLMISEAVAGVLKSEIAREEKSTDDPTRKSLHVIHIANDPEEACLTPPSAWRNDASAKVLHFFDSGGGQPRCMRDIAKLEQSFSPSHLLWLLAPPVSLISARRVHSERLVKQFQADPLAFWNYALSSRLTSGYDTTYIERGLQSLRKKRDEIIAQRSEEVRELVTQGAVSKEMADDYINSLQAWKNATDQSVDNSICRVAPTAPVPPLGWTLDQGSAQVMNCLLRTNIGETLSVPSLPSRSTKGVRSK